ncbi:MAG TPA: TetR/AcrR family transcriptional regulator [Roseiarcus sp.]|nr:TetR/AcrR family transcriptional regulator [Roseiarcus sp.]
MAKEIAKPDGGDVAPEPPRERIVACAQDLFHRHGIRGVGVETIAEAAGTNKMTLYRHFGSKDDLVCEYLSRKGRKSDEIWAEVEAASSGDPVGQLYGYVARVAKFIAEDERGCDLANAAVELTQAGHPGLRVIEEFKKRQRDRLARLCESAGARQPGLLADTIVLLIEGARVSRLSVGTGGPSANLARTSEAVIASFGVPSRAKGHSRKKATRQSSRRGA